MRLLTGFFVISAALVSSVTAFVPSKSYKVSISETTVTLPRPSSCFSRHKAKLKASTNNEESGFLDELQINPPYALAYIGFLGFAYFMTLQEAPGASQEILEKILADPVNPGINELFASVFNLLGLAAFPLACLVMPGAKFQRPLPAAPFLLGGVFAGYGSIGILMSTRKSATEVSIKDLGWVTKNILENKVVSLFAAGLALSTFYSTGFIGGFLEDAVGQIQGYRELLSTTAIASASSCDLAILTLTAASLIPEDLKRRGVNDTGKAQVIAASTILLPIVGATIYCAFRPSLTEE